MQKIKKFVKEYGSIPIHVKASLWFLICSFLQKGISIITTPIFTRIMETDAYGKFGVFNSWYGILSIIIGMNLFYGVHVQGIIKFSDNKSDFTSSLLVLTTLLVFVWGFIYAIFHASWNHLLNLNTVEVVSLLILTWTSAVFNFWANEKRAMYSYKEIVIIMLIVSVLKPLTEIILIILFDNQVMARILGWALVEIICYSWMFVSLLKRGNINFHFWKYAILYSIPLVPHYLSQTVLNSADRIMIQNMVGVSESGIYSLAYTLSLIMTLFNTALVQTINPWIFQKIKDKRSNDTCSIIYICLVIVASVNLILIALAPEAVALFAPKNYRTAIWIIPPVAMSVFFMFASDVFTRFAFYYEKTKCIMVVSIISSVLNILLNYIFINQYGYMAAGYTTLLCFIFYCIFHYLIMRSVCKKYGDGTCPYDLKILILIAMPFVIVGFSIMITYNYPMIRYGLVSAVVIVAFFMREKIIEVLKMITTIKKNR